jgi:cytochrome c oxidase cbb3-type subunit 3
VEQPGSYADCVDCHQLISTDDRHTAIVGLSPGDLAEGQALFGEYCARCHGEDGEQAVETATGEEIVLNSLEFQSQQDAAGILVRIAAGAGELMPAFGPDGGGPLSWDQVRSLTTYVRAWGPHAIAVPTVGDAAYGAELYAEHCAACHGSEGQGGPAAREPINTTEYLAGISNDALRQIIVEGVSGMPGYANRLTDEFVDDLIAFMRSWQQ